MEKYYIVEHNGKILGILSEQTLLDSLENKEIRKLQQLKIREIPKEQVLELMKKNKELVLANSENTRDLLKHKIFIKDMVESIQSQLMVKPDMDIVLPEKAMPFLKEINQELQKKGIVLKNPIRECVDDLSPFEKFQQKLERDKLLRNDTGREREG